MKTLPLLFAVIFSLLFVACNNDGTSDIESNIQPAGDKIIVSSEIFDIQSENYVVSAMYTRQDSFLLGTYFDANYGTTHADILAQVEHPENHVYPANTTPDSVLVALYYRTYLGDKYSPMHVNVYEMNLGTFDYSTPYPSNLNPEIFTDKSLLIGEKTFTAVDAQGEKDSTYVLIKLSDDFLQRFTQINADTYASEANFLDFFKGLYITTDFGSASMLNIQRIDLEYYHHYTYSVQGSTGQDSTVVVNQMLPFPANKSVRQVNRFLHPDTDEVITKLENQPDQVHHISSPANIYSKIILPIKQMQQQLHQESKRLTINNATLRVDIADTDEEQLSQPRSGNLLMIKEHALNRFFNNNELPADSVAILGSYTYATNPETQEREYFYSFDVARLLASEFEKGELTHATLPDNLDFILVPVNVKSDSNGNVTEVAQQYLLSAVTICGGNHTEKPIKAKIIYSQF